MEVDYEYEFYKTLNKVKSKTGNIKLITKYCKDIAKYFEREYLSEDYDFNNFEKDIADIGNLFINNKKYDVLNDILEDKELTLIVSIIANQIESEIVEDKNENKE